ncbi:hypothetical protein D3C72_1735520 [compost metagenome]
MRQHGQDHGRRADGGGLQGVEPQHIAQGCAPTGEQIRHAEGTEGWIGQGGERRKPYHVDKTFMRGRLHCRERRAKHESAHLNTYGYMCVTLARRGRRMRESIVPRAAPGQCRPRLRGAPGASHDDFRDLPHPRRERRGNHRDDHGSGWPARAPAAAGGFAYGQDRFR